MSELFEKLASADFSRSIWNYSKLNEKTGMISY